MRHLEKGSLILFQGDSITDGNRGRSPDPNHILGHGYANLIASRIGCDTAGNRYRFMNRGVSAHRITDLYTRWQEDAVRHSPAVISILCGINDLYYHSLEQYNHKSPHRLEYRFEKVYRMLVEETLSALPDVSFVLMEPYQLILTDEEIKRGNERGEFSSLEDTQKKREIASLHLQLLKETQEAVRRIAFDFDAVFVPLQSMFDKAAETGGAAYWLWDGVHPTYSGHQLIADKWMEEAGKRLVF